MPKILLVEDNEMNREMLTRRLARRGFEVLVATDGLQGVAMATRERPDLVLMDMSLPGIDGWEATRRLRADGATSAVPIVALTAHAMSDDRERALAAGCDEFDTKPVDLPRLLDKIHRLLESRSAPASAPQPAAPQPLLEYETTLPAVASSLPTFKAALGELCVRAGIDAAVRDDLQVVLDEACANVVKHAYPPDQPGDLRLALRVLPAAGAPPRPPTIEITLTDQGRPFNPLEKPTPDLSLSWSDRPLGGLGIHLIRTMTDRQNYSHSQAEGNRFEIVKHLPSPTPAPPLEEPTCKS